MMPCMILASGVGIERRLPLHIAFLLLFLLRAMLAKNLYMYSFGHGPKLVFCNLSFVRLHLFCNPSVDMD